jgi:hypothetical protein
MRRLLRTCISAVCGLMNRVSPICLVVSPPATASGCAVASAVSASAAAQAWASAAGLRVPGRFRTLGLTAARRPSAA